MTLKHKSKIQPSIIIVKDKNVTNPKNIANAFNNFFTNIGPSLSKTIFQSKNFKNLLNNSSLNSFVLKLVTHDEVRKLISQLNNRKALGPTSRKTAGKFIEKYHYTVTNKKSRIFK